MTQYARARTWLAGAKDDWLLPLTKQATEELIAEHDELVKALQEFVRVNMVGANAAPHQIIAAVIAGKSVLAAMEKSE